MSHSVQNVPERERAISHLIENLAIGAHDHSVSAEFLARIESFSLSFSVMAFRNLSRTELLTLGFAYGHRGEAHERGFGVVNVLAEQAAAFFSEHEDGALVLEHSIGKRTDQRVRNLSCGVRFLGNEVYSVVTASDAKTNILEQAILEAGGAKWFTGFFLARDCAVTPNENTLPSEFPSYVCEEFRIVFTQAFDGEGVLFGERGNAGFGPSRGHCVPRTR